MSLMVSPGSKGGSSISANLLVSLRTWEKYKGRKKQSACFHKTSLCLSVTGQQYQRQQIFKDFEVLIA